MASSDAAQREPTDVSSSAAEEQNRNQTQFSYDEVPYLSDPFPHTHPSHLATIAKIFGMDAPELRTCRVLELGSAAGGNLIPMAQDLPDGKFVGIDLSKRQIEEGQAVITELQAKNVELRHLNIMDVDESFGNFDYIICHGVYSWVPHEVQDQIMRICQRHLTEKGVAYISYNTFPGWNLRGAIREMMQYHVGQFQTPAERVQQARCLLDFLIESAGDGPGAYQKMLAEEAQILKRHSDTYVYHEHLEENNEPLYFFQFMERAEKHGLQYLGEAEFASMLARNFKQKTFELLKSVPILRQEQYMDFIRNRTFRRTLLAHGDTALNRTVSVDILGDLHLNLEQPLQVNDPDVTSNGPTKFIAQNGTVTINNAITKAAVQYLNETWPRNVHFQELFKHAQARAMITLPPNNPGAVEQLEGNLQNDLMTLFGCGILAASIRSSPFTIRVEDRPQTRRLARLQAKQGNRATNGRHESVLLDGFGRHILMQLDGTKSHDDILSNMQESITNGTLQVKHNDTPVQEVDKNDLAKVLQHTLKTFAVRALLREPQESSASE